MENPLISQKINSLPAFQQIKSHHMKPAIKEAIDEIKLCVSDILQDPSALEKWSSFQGKLEYFDDKITQIWSPIGHLNAVMNTPEIRQAHEECLMLLTEFGTWLNQHNELYLAYEKLIKTDAFQQMDPVQQKIIHDKLRDFHLSGISLSPDKKKVYADLQKKLSKKSSQFSAHLIDATQAWSKQINDTKELLGLSEDQINLLHEQAKRQGEKGYRITLDTPCFLSIMTSCENRALREEIYRAYTTKASDQGPYAKQYDNTPIMEELLQLREQKAHLLNFKNYAEYALETCMASSPDEVLDFLYQLVKKSKPQAEKEFQALQDFASSQYHHKKLEAWDIAYYSEKFKESSFGINEQKLRSWFPIDKVLPGLFTIVQRLYGITVKQRSSVDVWHQDVQFYEIYNENQERLGQFYVDLYARANKQSGAWMDVYCNRFKTEHQLQTPVAYLVCNFAPPLSSRPALLLYDEVVTLFHEFGHVLHHLLTAIDHPEVAGISGVPQDAVELPSQFLENWCWQKESVELISGHYKTGETLPNSILDQLIAAKNFQAGMAIIRQLEFALFDMKLHYEFATSKKVQTILDSVRQEVAVFIPPAFNRFQHSFSHIFDGGYAAGYYSYLWAEVLSADIFAAFEEEGLFNKKTGQRFLNTFLSRGGSQEPSEMFIAFRGRKPSIDHLLRHKGISS